jgi:hypothetical protein
MIRFRGAMRSRIVETYRRLPDELALAVAAILSWGLAAVAGTAAGFVGVYLYDRGNSKGDDLAAFISGVLAVGTFASVVLFTGLRQLHHKISKQTPLFAWLFSLAGSLLVTVWSWPAHDLDHYLIFIIIGWIAILLFGLAAMVLCLRLFI